MWWTKASWTWPYAGSARGDDRVAAPGGARDDRRRAGLAARREVRAEAVAPARGTGGGRRRGRSARVRPRGRRPLRRSWNSSAAPVQTGSVPAAPPVSGPWSAGGVQRGPAAPAPAAPAGADLGVRVAPARPARGRSGRSALGAREDAGEVTAGGRGWRRRRREVEGELEGRGARRREGGAGTEGAERGRGGGAESEGLAAGQAVAGARCSEHGMRAKGPLRRQMPVPCNGPPRRPAVTRRDGAHAPPARRAVMRRDGAPASVPRAVRAAAAQHDVVLAEVVAEPRRRAPSISRSSSGSSNASRLPQLRRRSRDGGGRRWGRPARSRRCRRRRAGARAAAPVRTSSARYTLASPGGRPSPARSRSWISWALRQHGWRSSSASTCSRAPPARWPVRASSRRACAPQSGDVHAAHIVA